MSTSKKIEIPMPTRKENSHRILLENPYISKSVIQQVLGTSPDIAEQVFGIVKGEELKRAPLVNGEPLDFRPHRVPTKLFLKITQQDYRFLKKQFEERNLKE